MARGAFALALALVAAACARQPQSLPLTEALLGAAARWGQGPNRSAFARAELDRIAARVRERAGSVPAHRVLADVVFREQGFVREVEDQSLDYVLLPSVLEQRRGSCVGLGSLYLALAERLGWRINGSLFPGHFFVILEEQGVHRHIELLHQGEAMPVGWHRQRFAAGLASASAYGRALSRDEVLGVVEYDAGNQRRRAGRLLDARQAYDSARRHFPDFAEAHASAGAVAQLLGALDVSLEAYRAAQRANPALPGVTENLELLAAERAHGRLTLPP